MATATALRNDIYLSVLAGRAITALADLAEKPAAWNEQIRRGLEDGIEYCRAVGETSINPAAVDRRPGGRHSFKHLATHDGKESSVAGATSERKVVERLLTQLLSRSRKPRTADLIDAIEFFTKNVGDEGC
jgi:hypothetical protein